MFFIMWLIFMGVIGWWASEWKRSVLGFLLLAFFLSPFVAGLILTIKGRNKIPD